MNNFHGTKTIHNQFLWNFSQEHNHKNPNSLGILTKTRIGDRFCYLRKKNLTTPSFPTSLWSREMVKEWNFLKMEGGKKATAKRERISELVIISKSTTYKSLARFRPLDQIQVYPHEIFPINSYNETHAQFSRIATNETRKNRKPTERTSIVFPFQNLSPNLFPRL